MTGRRVVVGLVALALIGALVVGLVSSVRNDGVGYYDQQVMLETDRPVRRVACAAASVGDEERRQAEESADPHLFEWSGVERMGDNRYVAHLKYTSTSGPLRRTAVRHDPHLVVHVEFADGTRACRVVELPPGAGGTPVTVRVP